MIYGLLDPETKELKYVGKTSGKLTDRLSSHLWCAKKSGRKNLIYSWMRSLLNRNLKPEIFEIDSAETKDIDNLEIFYIQYFKTIGCDLKNQQPGGNGQAKGFKFKNRYVPPKGKTPEHLLVGHGFFKNKKRSAGDIDKIKKSRTKGNMARKKILAENISTGEIFKFESVKAAAEKLNVLKPNISFALHNKILKNGGRRQVKGYYFEYQN